MANQAKRRMLIVDGYNVLNQDMRLMQGKALDDARDRLIRDLHDYAGYSGQRVIAVFDAWQSDRKQRTEERMGPLSVVFTKRGEMADHYIERLCDQHAREVDLGRLELRVATSDAVEQTVVFGRGAIRVPARELLSEMETMRREGARAGIDTAPKRATLLDGVPESVRERLLRMRRGG